MKKNRIIAKVMFVTLCMSMLVGCSKETQKTETATNDSIQNVETNEQVETNKQDKDNEKTYQIVCTTFPQYDWIKEIIGDKLDKYEMTLLLDQGMDLHSYQPTAADVAKIAQADLFIYVGGESDGWVDDALKEATNKDMKVINMLDSLGESVKEEEVVEGMQAEEEEEEEEEEGPEYDEHVWLSVKNAIALTDVLSNTIQQIDPEDASIYQNNSKIYEEQLKELDSEYETVANNAEVKTVLFGDRFPFRYLMDDYNISYYAAFVGCSAETEASFETVTFLAQKEDELALNTVLVIENSDQKIAQTIIQNTKDKNQQILVMNSLQSVTSQDIEAGESYLKVMKANLEVLKQALQSK